MEIVRQVPSMKELCRKARVGGRRIGFVPTMGALHEGHLSLVRQIKEQVDIVVVSIFVNPTQFGPDEDLESYPRSLTADVDLCVAEGVDYVFAPAAEEIYPDGSRSFVDVERLTRDYEGASRPGHFRGVATVVLKLFNIVQPHVAAFGQKDFQQAVVIRRMTRDLMLDVEVLVLPIVRDGDGLALSSRNRYLTPELRRAATAIPRALEAARQAVFDGERRPQQILSAARDVIESEELLRVDYLELVDPESLEPLVQIQDRMALLVAVFAGNTRLLDNTLLSP